MTLALHTFLADTQPDLVYAKIDADNETVYSTALPMAGYQGVVFFAYAAKGEVASFALKLQQDTVVGMGSAADLLGTKVTFATAVGTDGFAFCELQNPIEGFVRAALVVPNITTPGPVVIIAVRYGKNWLPETNADGETHIAPAEGTA